MNVTRDHEDSQQRAWDAEARVAALEAENERLRADLATFTAEPDIRVRLEADRVTYWYNQTRLMDAKVERLREALQAALSPEAER